MAYGASRRGPNWQRGVEPERLQAVKMTEREQVLGVLFAASMTVTEKGEFRDESVTKFFRHDPYSRPRFETAESFEARGGRRVLSHLDIGIGLDAKRKDGDSHIAVQRKFFAPDHVEQTADIDSVFTASGMTEFTGPSDVVFIDKWGPRAREALANQQSPVSRLDRSALAESRNVWSGFVSGQPRDGKASVRQDPERRPHQEAAVEAVITGLADAEPGQPLMSCGSAKTSTSLRVSEQVTGAKSGSCSWCRAWRGSTSRSPRGRSTLSTTWPRRAWPASSSPTVARPPNGPAKATSAAPSSRADFVDYIVALPGQLFHSTPF